VEPGGCAPGRDGAVIVVLAGFDAAVAADNECTAPLTNVPPSATTYKHAFTNSS
jgi:hypothetical protein